MSLDAKALRSIRFEDRAPRLYAVYLFGIYATLLAGSVLIESSVIDDTWLCEPFVREANEHVDRTDGRWRLASRDGERARQRGARESLNDELDLQVPSSVLSCGRSLSSTHAIGRGRLNVPPLASM
mmetsp:Transcript_61314/g.121320  ORF Transcript_61314/g.121320 Transcript_61314/m.121320 type:complete len:126 (+) Transcript_61314:488-865(+)|eukprot:CAMPEP_0174705180 /NCGR_PEP_ID=MMETSP1094-20130205/8498_1 /TAXON_ID=156173 /ORGANISM="Chrysochromulina brevifilum, Strain UTEX LB 985" /LENGTH=125 /DNA_ID=CAMNT_0015903311 /DNA_START=193 /DNA_END=570 /DNA_ORIENTATION=-